MTNEFTDIDSNQCQCSLLIDDHGEREKAERFSLVNLSEKRREKKNFFLDDQRISDQDEEIHQKF